MILHVIIPYFKLTFFNETLESLAIQTDQRFKVYIFDDASPENPTFLLEKFDGQFDFEYQRFNENLGGISLVKQWERCIDLCGNDCSWIMILGDDDVLGANVVKEFYKNIEAVNNLNCNVVKFSTIVIDENGKEITKIFNSKEITKSTDAFFKKILNTSRSSLSEHVFRKSSFQKIGFKEYGLGWHSDDMAWLEFSNFKELFCINLEKVFIRVSEKSISGDSRYSIKKEKATLSFYSDLVHKHLSRFNLYQRNLILRIYESKIISVKEKSVINYFQISWFYAKNAYFLSVLRFTYRFIFKY